MCLCILQFACGRNRCGGGEVRQIVSGLAEFCNPDDLEKSRKDMRLKLNESYKHQSAGRIHRDGCFLRFGDQDFLEEFVDPRFDRAKCEKTKSEFTDFRKYLDEALVNVTLKAMKNGGFGAASVTRDKPVYALAQCWQPLNENSCRECLVNARSSLRDCDEHEARAFFTGCYLMYSTHKFFGDAAERAPGDDQRNFIRSWFFPQLSDHDVTHLTIVAVVLLILTSLGACISYRRFSRKRKAQVPSCSNFKYETLEKATESFHDSMKLGQGVAGSVYKGILPDGRLIAVKKLFIM